MKNTNIMIDIETLGIAENSMIISIGAVNFDENGEKESFYMRIDPESYPKDKFNIDASTFMWWMKQSDEARIEFSRVSESAKYALIEFGRWIDGRRCVGKKMNIWANSPSFDCSMLKNAFSQFNIECPWKFYQERDYRTIMSFDDYSKGIVESKYKRNGGFKAHNAYEDALFQAKVLTRACDKLVVEL